MGSPQTELQNTMAGTSYGLTTGLKMSIHIIIKLVVCAGLFVYSISKPDTSAEDFIISLGVCGALYGIISLGTWIYKLFGVFFQSPFVKGIASFIITMSLLSWMQAKESSIIASLPNVSKGAIQMGSILLLCVPLVVDVCLAGFFTRTKSARGMQISHPNATPGQLSEQPGKTQTFRPYRIPQSAYEEPGEAG
jgi:hypothetical protein